MDVMTIARPDPRENPPEFGIDGERARYEVDPDEMYPAALEYLRGLLDAGAEHPPFLAQYVGAASLLPESAFERALDPPDECPPDARPDRAQALELARLVFTALLRDQADGSIGLRITKSDRWRL